MLENNNPVGATVATPESKMNAGDSTASNLQGFTPEHEKTLWEVIMEQNDWMLTI